MAEAAGRQVAQPTTPSALVEEIGRTRARMTMQADRMRARIDALIEPLRPHTPATGISRRAGQWLPLATAATALALMTLRWRRARRRSLD